MATPGQKRRRKRRGWTRYSKRRQQFIKVEYEKLFKKHGLVCCALCGMPMARTEATLDHKIPLSRGGTNERSNIQLAHEACNMAKGNSLDGRDYKPQ